MSSNIICPICFGDYHSTEEVVSITCGHLFHNRCLLNWIRRSPTCPQCRTHYTGALKMFPQFSETADKSKENLKLKDELQKCIKSSNKLKENLLQTEGFYADLNERFETLQSQYDEQLKKNQNLLKNIADMEQQAAKEKNKFSGTQNDLGRLKFNEIHLRSLIKTLEDELNTLGIQLNIEMNLPNQKPKDELSEKIINLIKNVSYMVRVCVEKQMKKTSVNHRQRENEMDRQREYYDCDEQSFNYDQQYDDDIPQQNYTNQQRNYNQQQQGQYRQPEHFNNPNGGNKGYVNKRQYKRRNSANNFFM